MKNREYQKCSICGEWHWTTSECLPIYEVYYRPYNDDEPTHIRANNHEEAALKFTEKYNNWSENILVETNESIPVKVVKDGVTKYYDVRAELQVEYYSRIMTEEEYEKEIQNESD